MANRCLEPSSPKLNYIYWSPREVRIKYSETHTRLTRDGRNFREKKHTRFIVISADIESGFVRIMLDPAGDEHNHFNDLNKNTEKAYEQHYFDKAQNLIGEMENYDISIISNRLLNQKPKLFNSYTLTGRNNKGAEITIKDHRDVEKTARSTYHDIEESVKKYIDAGWLPRRSRGNLHRELRMRIYPGESKLAFRLDCLRSEIDYVISRIQEIQNQ